MDAWVGFKQLTIGERGDMEVFVQAHIVSDDPADAAVQGRELYALARAITAGMVAQADDDRRGH